MSNEVICRYFLRGTCRFGEYCRFAHTISINDLRNLNNTTINDNNSINSDDDAESINIDSFTVINNNQDLNEEITTTTTPTSRIRTTKFNLNTKDPNIWVMAPVFVPRKRLRKDVPCSSRDAMNELLDDDSFEDMFTPSERTRRAALTSISAIHCPNVAGPSTSCAGPSTRPIIRPTTRSITRASTTRPSTSSNTANVVEPIPTIVIDDDEDDENVAQPPPPTLNEKSYAEVVAGRKHDPEWKGSHPAIILDHKSPDICPFESHCIYGRYCVYTHGELCDMCGRFCLHPNDKEQRKKHIDACIKGHEIDMEISFAVQRSKDKVCGICFDLIMDKVGQEQRFGILPSCNHVFCLTCIRKWRQSKQFESKITRSCPECRTPSDYVCPSPYWVDTKEDKEKLLKTYKNALGRKDCKYFKKGEGKCPFGNKCFYKHALPNGQIVDVGGPNQNARKVYRNDDEILELFDQVFPQIYLWDFVEHRDMYSPFISEANDSSDWSDEDLMID